jgi:hypothetical protein
MTKHVSRASRWEQIRPSEYRSAVGRVYFQAGAWNAEVIYRVLDPEAASPDPAPPTVWRLGRLKRPRNAMLAVERKVQELQGRHREHLIVVEPAGPSKP